MFPIAPLLNQRWAVVFMNMLDLCMNTNFYLSIQSHPQLSTWSVLKVHKDLFAPSLPWSHTMLGLSMPAIDGCRPFILIPCHLALHVSPQKGMQQLYNSLSHIQMHSTLTRGHGKTIFGDKHQRVQYNTLGVRPNRVGMGVIDFDPWAEMIGCNHWHTMLWWWFVGQSYYSNHLLPTRFFSISNLQRI